MADRAKLVAALDYLSRIDETMKNLQSGAKQFGAGVIDNLTGRAKDLGGLIYEAGTSDPNMGRMTTAEFSQAAAQRPQTPNLDQMWGDLGTMGKAIVTQPIQTGKAIVQGEVERAKEATSDPRAAGNYAGSFIDPMRLAKALRARPSMRELDAWHGSPHRFPPTEANPLGEFDSSKIGTGEGAQAYGHGTYLAESQDVGHGYAHNLGYRAGQMPQISGKNVNEVYEEIERKASKLPYDKAQSEYRKMDLLERLMGEQATPSSVLKGIEGQEGWGKEELDWFNKEVVPNFKSPGSLYKVDLPDEMIDRMLDYDKNFNEQPENIKEALRAFLPSRLQKTIDYYGTEAIPMNQIFHHLGNDAVMAEKLRQAGIPGIKYLDAGSRGQGGSGTRNFVVFPGEEKKVKILERK